MAEEQQGAIAAGFSLLWRRQGVLWWVFVVNLACGLLGTVPAAVQLGHALDHSLAGQQLTHGFHLGMFAEILRLPESNPMRTAPASYVFALLFLVFMLFVTGGILETYRENRRLTTGEFFAASGGFFWRFLRLALLSIIPFVIVNAIYQGLDKAADKIGDRAIADQVGIFLSLAAVIILLLLALWVRLWFDMAQVRAVVLNERGMWRNTWRAWRLTWRHLRHLWSMYVVISLAAWIALAIGLLIWAHLPSRAHLLTFLVLQFIVFAYLATRLWQLSSAMTWYLRHPDPAPVVEVVEAPIVPLTPAETEQIPPPPDPGPELPPADA